MAKPDLPTLRKLVGQRIVIKCAVINDGNPATVNLINLDAGGIWIESQAVTEQFLSALRRQQISKTPVVFVPFQQIEWVLSAIDYPALSESKFGIPDS